MSRSPEQSLKLPPHPRAERKRSLPIIAVFTKKRLLQASGKALPVTPDPPVTKPSADAELSLGAGFLTAALPHAAPGRGQPRGAAEPRGASRAAGGSRPGRGGGRPGPNPAGAAPWRGGGAAAPGESCGRGRPAGPGAAPPRGGDVSGGAGRPVAAARGAGGRGRAQPEPEEPEPPPPPGQGGLGAPLAALPAPSRAAAPAAQPRQGGESPAAAPAASPRAGGGCPLPSGLRRSARPGRASPRNLAGRRDPCGPVRGRHRRPCLPPAAKANRQQNPTEIKQTQAYLKVRNPHIF